MLPTNGLVEALAIAGTGLSALILFLAGAILFATVRAAILFEVGGVPLYLAVAVGLACLIMGVVWFWARHLRKSRSVAVLQIVVAVISGAVAFFASPDPIGKWLVVIAAVVTVANGLDKLWKAHQAYVSRHNDEHG